VKPGRAHRRSGGHPLRFCVGRFEALLLLLVFVAPGAASQWVQLGNAGFTTDKVMQSEW